MLSNLINRIVYHFGREPLAREPELALFQDCIWLSSSQTNLLLADIFQSIAKLGMPTEEPSKVTVGPDPWSSRPPIEKRN